MYIRPLGLYEYHCKLGHEIHHGTGLIVLYCRINGILNLAGMHRALRQIVSENALLRVTFGSSPTGEPGFQWSPEGAQLPLRHVQNSRHDDWQEVFEQELNRPIPLDSAYLWRVMFMQDVEGDEDKHDVILTCHHSIGDATSCCLLLDRLLITSENLQENEVNSHKSGHLPPSLESVFPEVSPTRYFLHQACYWFRTRHIKRTQLSWENTVDLKQRTSCNIFREIEGAALLVNRCRQYGTTLTAFLSAVLLKAVRQYIQKKYGQTAAGLKVVTAVDLRKAAGKQLDDVLGVYVSTIHTFHKIDNQTDVWELARDYKRAISTSIDKRCLNPRKFNPQVLAKKIERSLNGPSLFKGGVAISNAGTANFQSPHHKITQLRFCSNRQAGDFLITVNSITLNGVLGLAFTYTYPLLSSDSAKHIVDDVMLDLSAIRDTQLRTSTAFE